jgi:hypothetical protein
VTGPHGPTPSPARVTFLADHIDLVVGGLHTHHEDEDALLFPKLIERAPEQAPVTEQVEHRYESLRPPWTPRLPRTRPGASGPKRRPAKHWRRCSIISTLSSSPISITRNRKSSRSPR